MVDYLRFRVGPGDAADVAAGIFVRAWAARAQFDPDRGSPAGWLWGIARNGARAWWRGRPRPVDVLANDFAVDAGLLEHGARAESMVLVSAALARLEPIDQEIVALRFGAGLSFRAVGDAVGLTEGAATVRLHRTIRRLRLVLAERQGS